MVQRCGQISHGVGRPTYREASEIDHIITSAEAAPYIGRRECRTGEREGDHASVWAEFKGKPMEKGRAEGKTRAKGQALKWIEGEEAWAEYGKRLEATMEQGSTAGPGATPQSNKDEGDNTGEEGKDARQGGRSKGEEAIARLQLRQDTMKGGAEEMIEEARKESRAGEQATDDKAVGVLA